MSNKNKPVIYGSITEEFLGASFERFEALKPEFQQPSQKTFDAFKELAASIYGLSTPNIHFDSVNWHDIVIVTMLPNVEDIGDKDKQTYRETKAFRKLCADFAENKPEDVLVHMVMAHPTDEIPVICCDIRDLQDLMFDIVDIKQPKDQDELREHIGMAKVLSEHVTQKEENRDFRMF